MGRRPGRGGGGSGMDAGPYRNRGSRGRTSLSRRDDDAPRVRSPSRRVSGGHIRKRHRLDARHPPGEKRRRDRHDRTRPALRRCDQRSGVRPRPIRRDGARTLRRNDGRPYTQRRRVAGHVPDRDRQGAQPDLSPADNACAGTGRYPDLRIRDQIRRLHGAEHRVGVSRPAARRTINGCSMHRWNASTSCWRRRDPGFPTPTSFGYGAITWRRRGCVPRPPWGTGWASGRTGRPRDPAETRKAASSRPDIASFSNRGRRRRTAPAPFAPATRSLSRKPERGDWDASTWLFERSDSLLGGARRPRPL